MPNRDAKTAQTPPTPPTPPESWNTAQQILRDHVPDEKATTAEVARGLAATVRWVEALHNEVKEFAISRAVLLVTIASMDETMKELKKAILSTDPTSLTLRIVAMERDITDLTAWRTEKKIREYEIDQVRHRIRHQFNVALFAATVSFVGSLIINLVTIFLKK